MKRHKKKTKEMSVKDCMKNEQNERKYTTEHYDIISLIPGVYKYSLKNQVAEGEVKCLLTDAKGAFVRSVQSDYQRKDNTVIISDIKPGEQILVIHYICECPLEDYLKDKWQNRELQFYQELYEDGVQYLKSKELPVKWENFDNVGEDFDWNEAEVEMQRVFVIALRELFAPDKLEYWKPLIQKALKPATSFVGGYTS